METLRDKELGRAEKIGEASSPSEEDVFFILPYGEDRYRIELEDDELDFLLSRGLENVLGKRALTGFDASIPLPSMELPLYTGARSIDMKTKPSHFQEIEMGVSVVTMSMVHEHRGILRVRKDTSLGDWSKLGYETQPPLKDPE
jgi:hypothetical protein